MKVYRFILVLCLLSFSVAVFSPLKAADIEGRGIVMEEKNGNDVLLFFKDEIHLEADTVVDWYRTDGSLFQSATRDIYPDDGGYYFIRNHSYQSSPVYAFVYAGLTTPPEMTVTPDCDATTLRVKGNVAPFEYTRPDGTSGSYARTCTIEYTTLHWDSEAWSDSTVQEQQKLREGNYILGPLYAATAVNLCYDKSIRDALGLESDCIAKDVPLEDIKAVSMVLTSIATARNDSNELNRPSRQDIITSSSSSDWSGPLEVTFYANSTPGAQFCGWTIYHGNEVWKTRKDSPYHEFFYEPGKYRIVCAVNNQYCTSDSMEMIVAISESFLAVPNVFTPNGDHHNDEFRVAYRSLKEFHIWVYNRWGKLVYESTDAAKGWNGMIGNRPASEGAYYYVIRALGTDADKDAHYMLKASYQAKQKSTEPLIGVYQLSGDINLIR